jgi:hypothetical protein
MSYDEQKAWKTAAKRGMKTPEFKALQSAHTRLMNLKGPGLGVPIPHQSYYTKNPAATNFMKCVTENVKK